MSKKVILMILDGWGIGKIPKADAIKAANTPNFDNYLQKYSNSTLITFGSEVGLPKGQMGNSEVGHLNLGAGRVVFQELARLNNMVEDGSFFENKILIEAAKKAAEKNTSFHLMGLVSDGGIHSHINHAKASIKLLNDYGVKNIYVHAFTDGRDTDPKSGKNFVSDLNNFCNENGAQLVSVIGRYYAMDRDKRWPRIKLAYDMLLDRKGELTKDIISAIEESYKNEVTDEFIKPICLLNDNGEAIGNIKEGDSVFCFNFRTDRCRQITNVLTQQDMPDEGMQTLDLNYITMTEYDEKFKGLKIVIEKDDLKNTLGEVLEKNNKKQLRVAETEKYPHVTFFYSGGRELPFDGENRILANSPKVATYDLQPEMSAYEVTDKLINSIENEDLDFIVVNYANTDMVGHTGVFEAAMKAAETVDECVGKVVKSAIKNNFIPIIIADHGNADFMINEDGSPNTAHSTNLVPLIVVDKNYAVKAGKLGDIAPSILNIMEIAIPNEMTGEIIINEIS